jgi:nicotinamide-nucleotide amidase
VPRGGGGVPPPEGGGGGLAGGGASAGGGGGGGLAGVGASAGGDDSGLDAAPAAASPPSAGAGGSVRSVGSVPASPSGSSGSGGVGIGSSRGSAPSVRTVGPPMIPATTLFGITRYRPGHYSRPMATGPTDPAAHPIRTAELLSIGTELTVGDTRDTNAGELARSLTAHGVEVLRMTALPDREDTVRAAFAGGLERAGLIVSTGGLGPTPDDLTREAIAATLGETPTVDPELEAWLRELWRRRDMPFPELNLKQAWLIPSATALPNPNGTAPGWFVRPGSGPVIVALPGPPREMRPMWHDEVLPRLRGIGLGADVASRTYRLAGIGESQVADRLGEALLRTQNPEVATYARAEAVDVRISAVGDGERTAEAMVEATARIVLESIGEFVWATGDTSWSNAIGARLGELGWSLSVVEIGTGGQVGTLFGDVPWLRFDESLAADSPGALAHGSTEASADEDPAGETGPGEILTRFAERARQLGGSEVGMAVRATPRRGDTAVSVAIVTPDRAIRQRRVVFLDGTHGRTRAALSSASVLFEVLRR